MMQWLLELVVRGNRSLELQVEQKLMKFTPDEFKQDAHHWFILHGRYICTARKPRCTACVIYDLCEYKQKTDE